MPAKGQDMQTSIFLAKLMGPVFLALGAALLVNGAAYRTMARALRLTMKWAVLTLTKQVSGSTVTPGVPESEGSRKPLGSLN